MDKHLKIAVCAFMAVFGVYGLAICGYQFSTGKDGILNGVLTLLLGVTVCLIIYLSFFGKWGVLLRRYGRYSEADALDREYEEKTSDFESENGGNESKRLIKKEKERRLQLKAERRERNKQLRKGKKFKFKPASIAPLLVCLAGSAVMFTVAGFELYKTHSEFYVKAQAVIRAMYGENGAKRLVFELTENGQTYITAAADSWAGINFIAGNAVTVYHPLLHPEVIWQPSTAIMLCTGGGIFFGIGIIAFFAENNITEYVGIPCGLLFAGAGVCFLVAAGKAGGFNLGQLLLGGPLVYGSVAFICFGIYFFAVGAANIYRRFSGDELL